MNNKRQIAINIPLSELGKYEDYVGSVFKNQEDGSYKILKNTEEIIKANYWQKCYPIHLITVEDTETINQGDVIINETVNQELNLKPFIYLGPVEGAYKLIQIMDLTDETKNPVTTTTDYFLDGAMIYHGQATEAEKEEWIKNENA